MASVLETFFFLFEADASKLEKGLDEADKKTQRLEKDIKGADAAGANLGGTLLRVAGAVGAALGGVLAFGSVKQAILETADAVDTLGKRAAMLNIPVEDLDAYSRVAKMSGGSAEDFAESLKRLNEQVVEMAATGKGPLAEFAKHVGLSLADIKKGAKDPIFALGQVAEKFKELSRTEAAGLGVKLGLGPGTIAMLTEGRAKLDEMVEAQRAFGVTTTEQAEKAAKFNDTMDEWNAQFGTLKRELVTTALPPLVEFLKVLTRGVQWMQDNKAFVVTFFSVVAATLVGVYAPAALTAAAATWALIGPYVAVAAAVALAGLAIALVSEDLYNFGQGNDSVIGRIAEKWPLVGDAIRAIGQVLAWLVAFMGMQIGFVVDLLTKGPKEAFENLSASFSALVTDILGRFPKLSDAAGYFARGVKNDFDMLGRAWDWLVEKLEAGVKIFRSLTPSNLLSGARGLVFGEPGTSVAPTAQVDRAAIERGSAIIASTRTPLASQTSNSITNQGARTRNTTVQTGPITVQTQASDGQQVAQALSFGLSAEIKSAIDDTDDAVLA